MTLQHHRAGQLKRWMAASVLASAAAVAAACAGGDATSSEGEVDPGAAGGGTGSSGKAGAGGSTAGSGGSTGGQNAGGKAGTGGTAGTAGAAGKAGASGTAGASGSAGAAGKAGSGGVGGAAGGVGGAGGAAGGASGASGGKAGAAGDPNCPMNKEVCDGVDNNCNGVIDEGNPGAGEKCTVPKQLGECANGITACSKSLGAIECAQTIGPSVEVCDGKDNDCNGTVDDAATDVGGPCGTGLKGECAKGTLKCQLGKQVCVPDVPSTAEVCDGKDNDCDGNIDNGFSGAGMPCVVPGAKGPCAVGQTTCMGGGKDCVAVAQASPEICDGIDNDCNGTIDDSAAVDGKSCDSGLKGQCAFGATQCVNKVTTCVPKLQPNTDVEICDGKDNDCDGVVDNIVNIKLECNQKFPSGGNVSTWQCTAGFCEISGCTSNFKDCDGSPSNGCEVNITGDVSNCGACSNLCNATSGAPSCSAGQCGITCTSGFGDCDGNPSNGCEQRVSDNTSNCGICGKTCSTTGGAASCNAGTCKIQCDTGKGDCDGNVDTGCETTTTTNKLHCGACGNACDTTNANVACSAGACTITSCKPGFADCNNDPSDGCEMVTSNNTANCGACGNACSNAQGVGTCTNGVCGINCASGFGDCDGNPLNGCETNINTSAGNCGICGKTCNGTNGTPSCSGGTCQIGCAVGWGNCDNNPDNGCETDKTSDPNNCNLCGKVCDNTNGTADCQNSVCKIVACNPGFGNCDGSAANGCETITSNNIANCGTCGNVCTLTNATCTGGACGFSSCPAGQADCNGLVGDGCEINLTNDVNHCGACVNAVCLAVNGSNPCTGGACVPACASGFGNCDGIGKNGCETDLKVTASDCGTCGNICGTNNASSTSCVAGACAPVCNAGWKDCDGNGANGCEKNVTGDVNNCGGCGIICSASNGTPNCVAGVCGVSGCTAPFLDCTAAAGCETNGSVDINNCGQCGTVCSNNHGTPGCASGNCSIACASGYGNCDGNIVNGCEKDVTGDVNNCGACGTACSNTANATAMSCSASTCQVATCAVDWFNVDGIGSNGCECKQDAIGNNCGAATALSATGPAQTFNLTASGADEDWFKIDFTPSAACGYRPRIQLSAGSLPIKMQVYTSCAGSAASGGFACTNEGGTSSGAAGVTSWDYNNSTTCGEQQAIDPTPAVSSFIKDVPVTVYVRVFQTGADVTKSCLPFTLTLGN